MDFPIKIEEKDDIVLHYAMLEFVNDQQLLAASSNNHVWEDFKDKNKNFGHFESGRKKFCCKPKMLIILTSS